MKIFITGGAGYVGRPVTLALAHAGHSVIALVRRPQQEQVVRACGAVPLAGDLLDRDSYAAAAASADAVVHLANPRGEDGRAVLETLLDLRPRHFVHTSVLFVLGDTPDGSDEDSEPAGALYAERAALEHQVLAAGASAVIRPGMVYGGGEGGMVSELYRTATAGQVRYVGTGENRWSLVHRQDVASLFRLVIEERASGVFHAVDDEPLKVREVAALAAEAANGSSGLQAIPLEQARRTFGAFADALCLDQPSSARRARALGWAPAWPAFRRGAAAAFAEFQAERGASLSVP